MGPLKLFEGLLHRVQLSQVMSLPQQLFDEMFDENRNRLWRLMGFLQAHIGMGHFVQMNKWQITKHNGIGLLAQGVLLSTMEYSYMNVYPEGVYHCAKCKTSHVMDHKTACFYSNDVGAIICQDCKGAYQDSYIVKAYVEGIPANGIQCSDSIEVLNMEYSADELAQKREESREGMRALNENQNTPFMYYGDKTITDFYHELIARRVCRRWRYVLERRRKLRLVKVLYSCVGLDMNAAIFLARSACVM